MKKTISHSFLSTRAMLGLFQLANVAFEVTKAILLLTFALICGAAVIFSFSFWMLFVN